MAAIWSDERRYQIWFEIEALSAEALVREGKVPKAAIAVIRRKAKINVKRILKIEETVKHDVIAFLTQLEEVIGPEARYLHLGLTSSDVVDTALSVQIKEAGERLSDDLDAFVQTLRKLSKKYRDATMVGRSHGIHAEPITFGVKVAGWLTEARRNQQRLTAARKDIAVGKLSGAVGTFAHNHPSVEAFVCQRLGLTPEPVATQVIPRDRHAHFLVTLAVIGGMLERIATELRHLQRTEVLEAEEPFSKGQKGSSAMPHKRNPIGSENICGLARLIRGNAMAGLENIALWHERDISHSSVERVVFPDTTILLDYALNRMRGILENLQVYPERMKSNLAKTEGFLATQSLLLALVKKGLDRQKAYGMVQKHALEAWTRQKSFRDLIEADPAITKYLSPTEMAGCFDTSHHFRHVKTLMKRARV
jgi:adenylosuccinate lyase